MNVTRMLWNDKLKCKQKSQNMDVIFLGCSGAIAALPILFYLGAKLSTTVLRNRLQMRKYFLLQISMHPVYYSSCLVLAHSHCFPFSEKRLAEILVRPSSSGDI